MYRALISKECTVEHCWRELRDQEKWRNHVSTKVNEDGQTEVEVVVSTSSRPLGRDATKRKGKSKVESSTPDISIEGRERVDVARESRVVRHVYLKRLVDLKEEEMIHRRSCYGKEEERKDMEASLKIKEYERSIIDTDLSDKSDAQKQCDLDAAIDEAIAQEAADSEDDDEEEKLIIETFSRGSSSFIPNRRRRRYINRDHVEAHNKLYSDYFSSNSVYNEDNFRRRFRMRRHVFLRIQQTLTQRYEFFQQKSDARGKPGSSPLQKCTAALRALAYGVSADALDENLRMGETTINNCTKKFARGAIECFGEEYLRKPTEEDLQRLLQNGEERGFPGMLGSIDCMHWQWGRCPTAWRGMYEGGHHGHATILLEAVASFDTWIWHAFFGIAGSNNDINVIDKSPVFDDMLMGRAPEVHYTINGEHFHMRYYLTDGIYPPWATFVKSIAKPRLKKHQIFAAEQEAARKDVERAFGILQSRFAIVKRPARFWEKNTLGEVMRACIILHNMIVEDERGGYHQHFHEPHYDNIDGTTFQSSNTNVIASGYNIGRIPIYAEWLKNNIDLRDHGEHERLKLALIEHVNRRYGANYV